jgi:hypothetical protein
LGKSVRYFRPFETLFEDCVAPDSGLSLEAKDHRHAAIIEVFRRMPEGDYQAVVRQIDSIHWFVPDYVLYGKIEPVLAAAEIEVIPGKPIPGNRVIYFSPRLEDESPDVITAVVAHELAHIALNHKLSPAHKEYELQEQRVFDRICEWGFTEEANKHRLSLVRRGLR